MNKKAIKSPWHNLNRPYLIAEIGGNHEGDFQKAKEMLSLAIKSGVDCVKFQIYEASSLVNVKIDPDRYAHFKKFELTPQQHIELAEICKVNGVAYNSSIWNVEFLDWIDPYLDFYKIGSGDLTCYSIIEKFAKKGKPIILSTGLSSIDEVKHAVNFIQETNNIYKRKDMLCLLQCTSMYPIPLEDANLRIIDVYKDLFGLSSGYSDHTEGLLALKVAGNMGASVLEFHFTDNRENKTFRDHKVSLIKDEVIELKKFFNLSSSAMGNAIKRPETIEITNNHHISFRRAIYPNRDISKGEIIKASDLIYLRPCIGTDSRLYQNVIGSRALKTIEKLQPLIKEFDYSK